VESDPIGLDGGINTYAYVGNSPLEHTDYLGLAKDCECGDQKKRCRCVAIESSKNTRNRPRWYGHDKWSVCLYRCRAGDAPEETISGTSPIDRQFLSYSSLNDSGYELGLYCLKPKLKGHYFAATNKFSARAVGYDWFNPVGSGSSELEGWAKSKCCQK
jgi:hypothetical protein